MAPGEAAQSAASAGLAPGCLTVIKPRNVSRQPRSEPCAGIDEAARRRRGSFLRGSHTAGSMARDLSLVAAHFWSLDPAQPLTASPFVKPDAGQPTLYARRPATATSRLQILLSPLTLALTLALDAEPS